MQTEKIIGFANTLFKPDPVMDEFTDLIMQYCIARYNKDENLINSLKEQMSIIVGKACIEAMEKQTSKLGKWIVRRLKQ